MIPTAATDARFRLTVKMVSGAQEWREATGRLGGHLLQSWRWGEFKRRHGWSPLRLLLSRDDDPVVAAQLLFRSFGPVKIGYAPRGPATAGASLHDLAAFTSALDGLHAGGVTAALFLEPDAPDVPLPTAGTLRWRAFPESFQPRRTIKVPLVGSDDDLLAAMKPKTRYNVRLAARRGVTTRVGGLTELPAFYRLLEETAERDHFGIHSVDYYRDVLDTFDGDAALLLGEFEGALAAGVLVIRHRDEAIYMYGASATALQRHMATYLVQFAAMRWARDHGCRVYDLWGIPHPDEHPEGVEREEAAALNVRDGLWGVFRFKQGFGGDIVEYPGVYERVYLPPLVAMWRRFGRSLG